MKCQLRWLILNSSAEARRKNAMSKINDVNQSDEALEADRMMTNAGRITDPRLIPPGHDLASTGPEELLAKLIGKNDRNASQVREMVTEFWKSNGEIIKAQRQKLDLLNGTLALPQRMMCQLLKEADSL